MSVYSIWDFKLVLALDQGLPSSWYLPISTWTLKEVYTHKREINTNGHDYSKLLTSGHKQNSNERG